MKKILTFFSVFILVSIVIFYIGSYIYDFKFQSCIYTEESLKIPEELVGVELYLENNIHLIKGNKPSHCTETLKSINNELISNDQLTNNYIYGDQYASEGRSVEPFAKGKKLRLEKIIAETKHGFSTIDSGSGPLYYLILKDDQGLEYKMIYFELGRNGIFLTYSYNNEKRYVGSHYLNYLYDKNQKVIGQYYNSNDYILNK